MVGKVLWVGPLNSAGHTGILGHCYCFAFYREEFKRVPIDTNVMRATTVPLKFEYLLKTASRVFAFPIFDVRAELRLRCRC